MIAGSEPGITLRRGYDASLKIITNPSLEVYMAEIDGTVVGSIVLNIHGAFISYIQSILVAPGWRNQGIGTRLMDFAEKRIFGESPNAFICVSSFNPDAQRLYLKLGYKIVGGLRD